MKNKIKIIEILIFKLNQISTKKEIKYNFFNELC